MPTGRNEPATLPFAVPVLCVAFMALGAVLALGEDGERAASIAVAGFGVWGLCMWSAFDVRSPVPEGARPWAPLAASLVAIVTGVVMAASGGSAATSSSGLSQEATTLLGVVFAAFFGIAGVVVALRLLRGRRSDRD